MDPDPPPLPPSAPPPPPPAMTSVLNEVTPDGGVQVFEPVAVKRRKHLPDESETMTPVVFPTST